MAVGSDNGRLPLSFLLVLLNPMACVQAVTLLTLQVLATMTTAAPAPIAPLIRIHYCTQCQWLLRAAWLAQELLSTFGTELQGVTLVPGTGGVFEIWYGEQLLWERRADGGFPEAKVLKQRVRDQLDPGRDLGHIDRTQRG